MIKHDQNIDNGKYQPRVHQVVIVISKITVISGAKGYGTVMPYRFMGTVTRQADIRHYLRSVVNLIHCSSYLISIFGVGVNQGH